MYVGIYLNSFISVQLTVKNLKLFNVPNIRMFRGVTTNGCHKNIFIRNIKVI